MATALRAGRSAPSAALLSRDRGLIVILIDALHRIELLGAVQGAAGLVQRRRRGDQVRLRGKKSGLSMVNRIWPSLTSSPRSA